jgi:hypothetical protein
MKPLLEAGCNAEELSAYLGISLQSAKDKLKYHRNRERIKARCAVYRAQNVAYYRETARFARMVKAGKV